MVTVILLHYRSLRDRSSLHSRTICQFTVRLHPLFTSSSLTTKITTGTMTSVASTSGSSKTSVTTKPWFVTYNEEDKDVLIWKQGERLKLQNGSSAGRVLRIVVADKAARVVKVSIYTSLINILLTMLL